MPDNREFHMFMRPAGAVRRPRRWAGALGAAVLAWAGVTGLAVPGPAGASPAPKVPPTLAPAGLNPQAMVLGPRPTLSTWPISKGNAVSVIDTGTCSARRSTGCAKPVATVHLGRNRSSCLGGQGPFRLG